MLAVSTLLSLTACNQEIMFNPDDFTVTVVVADIGVPRANATQYSEGDNTRPFTMPELESGSHSIDIKLTDEDGVSKSAIA